VDLGGYYLADSFTNKTHFLVPNNGHYRIPPGGFLLVWADNEDGQNRTNRADLHASFALSKGGDAVALFAADGTQIDAVTFETQTNDVSQGRFLDGSASIFPMILPTPREPNVLPNTAPILAAISDQEMTLGQTLALTANASDADTPKQLLKFSLGNGAPAGATIGLLSGQFTWKPTAAPDLQDFTVTVTDDGVPNLSAQRTFRVTVHPPPRLTTQVNGSLLQLAWPRGVLQEADEITGPYRDVTGSSPFIVDLSEASKFYRIRL
jgi:hypothetical protein